MKELKIGDKIIYQPWHDSPKTATVLTIEICKPGEKYGRSVKSCDLNKHHHGTVDLNNNHWCYFEQIKSIIKN